MEDWVFSANNESWNGASNTDVLYGDEHNTHTHRAFSAVKLMTHSHQKLSISPFLLEVAAIRFFHFLQLVTLKMCLTVVLATISIIIGESDNPSVCL